LDGFAAPQPLKVRHNDSADLEDLIGLGDGAYADWVAAGSGNLDADGGSPVSDILIHGGAKKKLLVRVEVKALIGALDRIILSDDFLVEPGAEVVAPVDVAAALGMHERQYAYPTRIRAHTAVVLPSGKLGKSQGLGQRFFVARKTGLHEVHDFDSFAKLCPNGITTAEEAARMQEIIRHAPADSEGGAQETFIASAVHVFVPDGPGQTDE
jgi:hypothetical protein